MAGAAVVALPGVDGTAIPSTSAATPEVDRERT